MADKQYSSIGTKIKLFMNLIMGILCFVFGNRMTYDLYGVPISYYIALAWGIICFIKVAVHARKFNKPASSKGFGGIGTALVYFIFFYVTAIFLRDLPRIYDYPLPTPGAPTLILARFYLVWGILEIIVPFLVFKKKTKESVDLKPAAPSQEDLAEKLRLEQQRELVTSIKNADTLMSAGKVDSALAKYNELRTEAELKGLDALVPQIDSKIAAANQQLEAEKEKKNRMYELSAEGDQFLASEKWDLAQQKYQQALPLANEFGDSALVSTINQNLAKVESAREQAERAKRVPEMKQMLNKALKLYDELPLSKLASLLGMKDEIELEKWLLMLPDDFPIKILGDKIKVDVQEGQDIGGAIDQLMDSFSAWESTKEGKIE